MDACTVRLHVFFRSYQDNIMPSACLKEVHDLFMMHNSSNVSCSKQCYVYRNDVLSSLYINYVSKEKLI